MESIIMKCWAITDDLDTLAKGVLEHDLTQDNIANIILGMKALYHIRFEELWEQFEASLAVIKK